jgi:hypothetical protein
MTGDATRKRHTYIELRARVMEKAMRLSLVLTILSFAAAAPALAQIAGPGVPSVSPGVPSYNPGVPSYNPGVPSYRPGIPAQSPGIVLGRPGGVQGFQPVPPARYYPRRRYYRRGQVIYVVPYNPYRGY